MSHVAVHKAVRRNLGLSQGFLAAAAAEGIAVPWTCPGLGTEGTCHMRPSVPFGCGDTAIHAWLPAPQLPAQAPHGKLRGRGGGGHTSWGTVGAPVALQLPPGENPGLQHQWNEFAGLIWSLIPAPRGQTAPAGGDQRRRGWRGWGCGSGCLTSCSWPRISPFIFISITFMQIKCERVLPAAVALAMPALWYAAPVATSCALGTPWALTGGFTEKHITLRGKKPPTLDVAQPPPAPWCWLQGMLEWAQLSPGHGGECVPGTGGHGCSSPRWELIR